MCYKKVILGSTVSDSLARYKLYSHDALIKECVMLYEQNRHLTMRLAAVKTIVSSLNPTCSEKLKRLMSECGGCEGESNGSW